MKKVLFIIASISAVLFSCKKEHGNQSQPVQKTYTVHFNVSGFSNTTVPFQTDAMGLNTTITADSLKNNIGVLYYLVYKNSLIQRRIVQHSTDQGFGTITDSFYTGTGINYNVVIVAGQTNLTDMYGTGNLNATGDIFEYIAGGTPQYFGDTFFKSTTFQVPNSSYNLTLDRIVAQLKVNIQDVIPATGAKISLIFNDYQNITAATGLPSPNTQSEPRTVQASVTPGTVNTAISTILLNIGKTFSVEIKCTDAANNVLADKTVTGVSCKANETTVLIGDLFGSAGTNFNISYDPTWSPPNEITF